MMLLTVQLIDKAADDLEAARARSGLSVTDLVNRAVTLYEFIDAQLGRGAELILRENGAETAVVLADGTARGLTP